MFSEQLKKLREDKGITQYELAEIIHVSRAAISKWERGQGIPSKCNLNSLCNYFEVTEEVFLSRDELIMEIEKINKNKENLKYHIPVILLSIVMLVMTVVELFVFVREGIHISNNRYYPSLSILTVLEGWSIIAIGIYISFIIFNILFISNLWYFSNKIRTVISIGCSIIVIAIYISSFIVSYNLIEPQNYGMFWKPH